MRPPPANDPCTWTREKSELFLDGELTGSENLYFTTHLKECEDCAGHWSDDEELASALLLALGREPVVPSRGVFSSSQLRVSPDRSAFDRSRDTDQRLVLPAPLWARPVAVFGGWVAALVIGVLGTHWFMTDQVEETGRRVDEAAVVALSEGKQSAIVDASGAQAIRVGDRVGSSKKAVAVDLVDDVAVHLAADSSLEVLALPDARRPNAALGLALEQGRLVVDSDGRNVRIEAGPFRVEARDGGFVLCRRSDGDEIIVLRGEVNGLLDGEVTRLVVGDAARISNDGVFSFVSHRAIVAGAELELKEVRAELAVLKDQLKRERESATSSEVAVASINISEVVDGYLEFVDRAGSVRLSQSTPMAMETAETLRSGDASDVVPHLVACLSREYSEHRRKALVGMIALVNLAESRPALEELSIRGIEDVRHFAVFCLAQRKDGDLGPHFLRVAQRDESAGVRRRASMAALIRGESESVAILLALRNEAKEFDSHMMTRFVVKHGWRFEATQNFLKGLFRGPATDSSTMRFVLSEVERAGDVDWLELLREFSERSDVTSTMGERAREVVHELERRL